MPQQQQQTGAAGRILPHTAPNSSTVDRQRTALSTWSIALTLLALVAAFAVRTSLLARTAHAATSAYASLRPRDALDAAILALTLTLATLVLARVEHRSFVEYGLRSSHPIRHTSGGALTGLVLISALVTLLHQLDLLVFRGQVLFGTSLQWRLGLEWLVFFAIAAFLRQFLAHGYLQYSSTRSLARLLPQRFPVATRIGIAFWAAALVLSLGFALLPLFQRNPAPLALLNRLLYGLLLSFSLWRTGSLWWAFGFDTAWHWAESFLWGVPDSGFRIGNQLFFTEATGPALRSGGFAGPEASIYMPGALLAGLGILMLLHRRHVYPELWHEAARDGAVTD